MADENVNKEIQIGDKMNDDTIFAGISPDTNQPMFVAPNDAFMRMGFNDAARYAENLEVGGKKGFRLPSIAELKVLFDNREKGALKGTFNFTSGRPVLVGRYWSSGPIDNFDAWQGRFGRRLQDVLNSTILHVRPLRR